MPSLRAITLLPFTIAIALAIAGCTGSQRRPAPAPEQTSKPPPSAPVIPARPAPAKPRPAPAPLSPMAPPKQIALLLPLSGKQQAAGIAVRDGFLSAWFREDSQTRPRVRIYDVAGQDVGGTLLTAIGEGAQFVVGPLTKDEVSAAAAVADGRVPMLALNFLAEGSVVARGFFQFALAPEAEAQQVAQRAVAEGRTRAAVLVPTGEWGIRLAAALTQELNRLGGKVVAQATYNPADSDYSPTLQQLFRLSDSRDRQARLVNLLGTKLEFEPRRRGDVQFIFVAAQPGEGRLIRPQLKFHYAGDVPMYTTSDTYEPDEAANVDLDGVLFPDMPWMLSNDPAPALRTDIATAWPARAARRGRLYAFGADACLLIPNLVSRLGASVLSTGEPIAGLTGKLTIDDEGRVHRALDWARIRDGKPVTLAAGPPPPLLPIP